MYKKITHHITEEHFGHPVATQIKKVVDKTTTNTAMPGMNMVMGKDGKPKAVNLQSQSAFKAAVQNYWDNYIAQVNQIITAVNGSEPSLIQAEDSLFSNIDALGNLLKQYYGTEVGERLNSCHRDLALGIVSIVRSLRDGADFKNILNGRLNNLVALEYGQVLQKINNNWNAGQIRDQLVNLANTWVDQTRAVQKNDTNALNSDQTRAKSIVDGLAKSLGDGIVYQFPNYFNAP
jgi:predicted XRE-type DNA-binding protein